MKEIHLYGGAVALVDDEDFDLVSQYHWKRVGHAGKPSYAYGYKIGAWKGPRIMMHRLILCVEAGQITDHINRNGLDNRRANLRTCTYRENNINKATRPNKTGFRGVEPINSGARFRARVDSEHCGTFPTAEQAARAYDCIARIRHGEFARTNFFYPWPKRAVTGGPNNSQQLEGLKAC